MFHSWKQLSVSEGLEFNPDLTPFLICAQLVRLMLVATQHCRDTEMNQPSTRLVFKTKKMLLSCYDLHMVKQRISWNTNRWFWTKRKYILFTTTTKVVTASWKWLVWLNETHSTSPVCKWGRLFPSMGNMFDQMSVPPLTSHLGNLLPFKSSYRTFQTLSESTCLSGTRWDSSSGYNHSFIQPRAVTHWPEWD